MLAFTAPRSQLMYKSCVLSTALVSQTRLFLSATVHLRFVLHGQPARSFILLPAQVHVSSRNMPTFSVHCMRPGLE